MASTRRAGVGATARHARRASESFGRRAARRARVQPGGAEDVDEDEGKPDATRDADERHRDPERFYVAAVLSLSPKSATMETHTRPRSAEAAIVASPWPAAASRPRTGDVERPPAPRDARLRDRQRGHVLEHSLTARGLRPRAPDDA